MILLKKYILAALIKSIMGTLLFTFIYLFANIQLVKQTAEDVAFDVLNTFFLESHSVKTNSPNLILFGIDDLYMRSESLLDENNQTNYGDFFPRDKLANFIKKINVLTETLSEDNQPKALFIDYDFSFKSTAYNKTLTSEDKAFLEVLKEPRRYPILIPKTNQYNYIESSSDLKIQSLIAEEKIILVSVALARSEDFSTKRYIGYQSYKHSITNKEHNYINASLAMWLLSNEQNLSISSFKAQSVVSNRIFIKNYKESSFNESNSTLKNKQSNWEQFSYYSANYPLDMIVTENLYGSLMMLGANYSTSTDKFNISASDSGILSGVEVHANTLMTIFNFNGSLKKYDFLKSLTYVFMVFFIIDIIVNILFDTFLVRFEKYKVISSFTVITLSLLGFSLWILIVEKEWFNWFIPSVLFKAVDVLAYIKNYFLKKYH